MSVGRNRQAEAPATDTDDEEVYVLGDMQSADVPETFEDVPLYDWYNIKDVTW